MRYIRAFIVSCLWLLFLKHCYESGVFMSTDATILSTSILAGGCLAAGE